MGVSESEGDGGKMADEHEPLVKDDGAEQHSGPWYKNKHILIITERWYIISVFGLLAFMEGK